MASRKKLTAAARRAQLVQVGREVFAEKGFQAATIREISSRAGANLAAVNYHFQGKDRLYIEAVRHAHCALNHRQTDIAQLN